MGVQNNEIGIAIGPMRAAGAEAMKTDTDGKFVRWMVSLVRQVKAGLQQRTTGDCRASHTDINPTGIIPSGPELRFGELERE